MTTLIKTRSVLDLDGAAIDPPDGMVSFDQLDDTGLIVKSLLLPSAMWADLGEPAQITITIEPGDALNV